MADLLSTYKIDPEEFDLSPYFFVHQSRIHGILHVYRVMYHCLWLGLLTGYIEEARLAFFAAYLHDLARKHDGYCTEHGRWAAEQKLPLFEEFILSRGVSASDIRHIESAIFHHSLPADLRKDHPSWKVSALLKDADALDRIRLGAHNLDKRYLRFEQTGKQVNFANALYFASISKPVTRFAEIVEEAARLESAC